MIHGIVAAIAPSGLRRLRFRRDGHGWELVARLIATRSEEGPRGAGEGTPS